MRIGLTYDLKDTSQSSPDLPDDFQEEFDSPATIQAITAALCNLGHEVEPLGNGRELLERLLDSSPDLVFNFAEGRGISRCREARVPAVLEMLGIPYTGSDPLTLSVTLDKDCARRLVHSAGVPVPRGTVIPIASGLAATRSLRSGARDIPLPAIVKPAWEGSSKGIRTASLVDDPNDLQAAIEAIQDDHRQPVLVEEYIEGHEITVGVLGSADQPRILGIMEVLPNDRAGRFIYSLEVKRDFERQVRYECPARLPPAELKAIEEAAITAYRVLGCRDIARVDFRVKDGVPYFLEVNPLPGLNPHSGDIVIMARLAGWSYEQLIASIVDSAAERNECIHALHQGTDRLQRTGAQS
jgi:D-alanine-D-alanine ligase